jgi:WD40 repeat protein
MSKISVIKKHQFSGHRDGVYRLEQGPEPNIFFSGAGDGMIVSWDLKEPDEGRLIGRMNNSIYALSYWQEADLIIAGHNYDGIHLLDWKSKKEKASLNITKAAIFDIKVYRNYAWIAAGDGSLIIVDLEQMKVVDRIESGQDRARSIAFNQVKGHAAVGYSDNKIRIFDLHTHEELESIDQAHDNSVFNLDYHPENDYLLSCGRDARIKKWGYNKHYSIENEVVAHMYTINHLTFSPDGQHFVSCSMDKSIKVWDAEQMKLLKVIDKGRHAGHGTSINRLLWTPFNNWLISASDDRSIAVWEITF